MTTPASRPFRPQGTRSASPGARSIWQGRRTRSDTEYVERGGEVVARHPFEAEHAKLCAFPMRADRIKLGQWCDRMFAGPTAGRFDYDPLLDHVVLTFADISTIRSGELPDRDLGYADEREAAIWVPLVERSTGYVVWTIAYMFVNRVAAVLCGREIYGFPKQFAEIGLWAPSEPPAEESGDEPGERFSITAEVLKEFKSTTRLCNHELLTLKPADPEAAKALPEEVAGPGPIEPSPYKRRSWGRDPTRAAAHAVDRSVPVPGAANPRNLTGLDALARQGRRLTQAPGDLRAAVHLFGQLTTGSVPLILLKQFRDVVDPTRACYQALAQVPEHVLNFHDGGWLPQRWKLTIDNLDGAPLYRDLGLSSMERDYEGAAFWLDFDFRIGRGTLLWEERE